ncbi:14168_t:CDS:2 [Racocetra fulgida]|uniref:14168_t:CDS:1 n=1 Tax=Racocetra fulgida TaxID=60492 RepID=A0A9N8WGJ7_9GLOM|nr:14168_t:CDS:2 [Racocetra fulgida]
MRIKEPYNLYEFDPKERNMFLNAIQDSDHINFDLYDKIILGRTKDYDYLSEPRIESTAYARRCAREL